MLILFDIDMTLITTGGAGMKAMQDAGVELFGPTFDARKVEYAGRLDPLIIDELVRHHGTATDVSASPHTAMRSGYRTHLARRLQAPGAGRALPGVMNLLDALAGVRTTTLGLLTGNFADTGTMKLRACGIEPSQFTVAAWGDDSPHTPPDRAHLPPVAVRRLEESTGRRVSAREVVVIGDTPHDARCALAHGHRCLGVATGMHDEDTLRGSGFDHVVKDLSDTQAVMQWLHKSA
jgi:phosphoglycolate phosphatase